MRKLLRPSGCTGYLSVAYLTQGYTFVPVSRRDIHRFMRSRRIISAKYTDNIVSELFERPKGATRGWIITDKWGQYKFTDRKAASRLMRRFEVDYICPVEFIFKPYLKKEYEYTLIDQVRWSILYGYSMDSLRFNLLLSSIDSQWRVE